MCCEVGDHVPKGLAVQGWGGVSVRVEVKTGGSICTFPPWRCVVNHGDKNFWGYLRIPCIEISEKPSQRSGKHVSQLQWAWGACESAQETRGL